MKPKYKVPALAEIAKLKGTNGYTLVSTFSGCGGSCLGFEIAGFNPLRAHEFIPSAVDTYKANHPDTPVDTRDIREVTTEEILETLNMKKGDLDVLEGSPPCASFSTAGKRERDWGKVKTYSDGAQRSDDLFFEFARLVEGLQPKVFVAENVSGLVKGTAKGYFFEILAALKKCGYKVEARLLDAQWLGVPQSRQRVIFVGVRNDLELDPVFPSPNNYRYSIFEALENVPEPTEEQETGLILTKAVYNQWMKTEIGKSNKKYFQLVRTNPNKPCPTITAHAGEGCASVCHFNEPRKFSIPEMRRLCSFPDDFKLLGKRNQRAERLGRSVPPLMMAAIAKTIQTEILDRHANPD